MVEPSHTYLVCVFQVVSGEPQQVVFTIPIFEPMPSQYYIKAVSDRWLGSEAVCIINFQHLILPERHPPHTGTVQQTHTHRQTNPQRCTEETTLHTSHIHLSLSFFLDKCTHTLSQCCPVDSQSCWTCSRCPSPPWGTRSTRVCTSSPTSTPSRHRSSTRSTTPTPTSCWGRQRAPVKPSLPSWPCSESSTSTLPPRSVCPLHSISLFFSFNIALHFSLFILALCVFSGGVHCPSESSGQGED